MANGRQQQIFVDLKNSLLSYQSALSQLINTFLVDKASDKSECLITERVRNVMQTAALPNNCI